MNIRKPSFGDPCNGCGICCMKSLCPLGEFLFDQKNGPCPALEKVDHVGFACGLVRNPQRYVIPHRPGMGQAAAILIGAGDGCDAIDENDTNLAKNDAIRRKWIEEVKARRLKVTKAKSMWGAL